MDHCVKAINSDVIYGIRLSMQEMNHFERDLILLGKISASTVISELTKKLKDLNKLFDNGQELSGW